MEPEINDLTNQVQELVNPDYLSDDELQGIVASEIDDAVDFIDNIVSPLRAKATEYYRGDPFGDEEDGRSQVVSMDVRDTVQAIMPSLMRVFTSGDKVVEYVPRGPEDVDSAKQATEYVNYIFQKDNPGFLVLHSAFKDALVRKNGIIKFWWDESFETETSDLTGLDDAALASLSADPNITVDVQSSYEGELPPIAAEEAAIMQQLGMPMPQPPMMHDVIVTRRLPRGRVKVEALPPEEFLIDRRAKSLEDAEFVAHRRVVTVSDLVAMGYDYDEVSALASDTDDMDTNVERYTRNPALTTRNTDRSDPASRKVTYIEAYIRVDRNGDGIAELRRVCVAGVGKTLLSDQPWDVLPFASFCPDPEPHDFFGMSMADIVMDIQRIKSVVMRNSLDSLAMSIHPRVAVTEGQVNIEDVMNTETGAIIRQRSPGQVQPLTMPYVGKEAFPVLAYMDETKQNRTGISRAAAGLDADALQSSTAGAVAATVNAAQQHIEMIARIFAETGMRTLFRGILRLVCQHQDQPRMVRLTNEFVPIDPRGWNATMDATATIALGRGTDSERMAMLTQIGQMQKEAMSTLGPINPLTDIQKLHNTLSEMTALAGFKDTSKFWSDPAQFQPPPQPPEKPDVNEQLIQAQIMQIQADMQMKNADLQLKRENAMREDDRKRDELEIEVYMKAAEIEAKYGTQLSAEQIKKSAAIAKEVMKAQADMVKETVRGKENQGANPAGSAGGQAPS
jgi:hypothetical protein